MLLDQDDTENTVLHMAARKRNAELLQKLLGLAKENLRAEKLNSKLLITKDPRDKAAWHEASDQGNRYYRNCGRGLKKI